MSFHFCTRIRNQSWVNLNPVPRNVNSVELRHWLLDEGSLTKRLKSLGRFSVEIINTGYGRPFLSEARVLGISTRQQVYIREVRLCVNGEALVKARSIIPRSTLTGPERQLLKLNSKPLGEYLFNHRCMHLGPIEVKQGQVDSSSLWGRRRVFSINRKPVLVSEFFLPAIQNHCE
ncbi:chorismate lyase [Bermanella marisrubri]|uniref:Probable chorismate pyruvate-lyase n=1 Tax=Bermanella marisrubri TaxID=207949 RepID=Q1N3Z5_9GAMM|nr:chorismate lyase [Bermanella marisrubri]EAT13070.1 chorismate--pyruvate lyase, putative [Oceanobacter sp. RED65] [Bermanella marisrubri]QIZ82814.1 chorismate lyase [Bermanella marisrubri]